MLSQFIVNGCITGILYSLSAIGFAIVYNTTRIFHIAAAALYVVAAYAFYFAFHTLNFPLWLSLIAALIFTALVSILCEWTVYKPLYNRKSSLNVAMISSIGVMTILVNLTAMLFGNETKVIDSAIQPIYSGLNIILTRPQIYQLMIGLIAIFLFIFILKYTRLGMKTKALSNDSTLFELLGFNVTVTRIFVFGLSGIFLGLGSCLTVYDNGMYPHMGMSVLINAMVAMIIGGVGHFGGCIVGGIGLGILQALIIYQFSANWQYVITFILLLIFLFFRPQGILGYKKRTV